jgi:hypothetical protein
MDFMGMTPLNFGWIKVRWQAPKFLFRPTWGAKYVELRKFGIWGSLPTSSTKGGWEGRARSPGIRLGRRTIMFLHDPASTTNPKKVSPHSGTPFSVGTNHGHLESLDSPLPRLGGNYHLPPYIILCSSPPRLHPNGTFLGTLKVESQNCPELHSRDFGHP